MQQRCHTPTHPTRKEKRRSGGGDAARWRRQCGGGPRLCASAARRGGGISATCGTVAASVRRAAHASLSLSLSPPLLSPSLPLSLSLSLCADLRVVPRDQDLEQAVRVRTVPLLTIKGGETFRVSIFFLSSLGGQAPHVRPVGVHRTCGEPNEIELTAIGVKLSGS